MDQADAARAARGARRSCDDLQPAFKMLARVSRILEQLVQAWDVLSTLTPTEYLAFRHQLGRLRACSRTSTACSSSCSATRSRHARGASPHARESRPSCAASSRRRACTTRRSGCWPARLRDRAGLRERDWTEPHRSDPRARGLAAIYRESRAHWDLYELAEELIDLEDSFRQWRFRHVTTVERIIGLKTGTGGTAGVAYLRRAVDVCCFPSSGRCAPSCSSPEGRLGRRGAEWRGFPRDEAAAS